MNTDSLLTYYVVLSFVVLAFVVLFPKMLTKLLHKFYKYVVSLKRYTKPSSQDKLIQQFIEFNSDENQGDEQHVQMVSRICTLIVVNIVLTLCAYFFVEEIAPLIYIIIGVTFIDFIVLVAIYRMRLLYSLFDYKSNYLVLKTLICAFIIFISTWNIIIFEVPDHGAFYYGIYGAIAALTYILLYKVYIDALRQTKENNSVIKQNMSKMVFIIIALFILALSLMIYMFCRDNTLFLVNGETSYLSFFNCLYFVVITFFTIGYGDIVPVGMFAKFFAIVISFTSLACITVLVGASLNIKSDTSEKK